MIAETERLVIRRLVSSDAERFSEMAADGSLGDIGFDKNCREWMSDRIYEARELTDKDDPTAGCPAYAIQLKNSKTVIGSVGCSYYEDIGKVGITP